MKVNLKRTAAALLLSGSVAIANASVCNSNAGNITCDSGTLATLTENGMVTVNGTTVTGATKVNGQLNAKHANLSSLDVNGNAELSQCTIKDVARIKGSMTASSTQFENTVDLYSSKIRLTDSTVKNNLHFFHTDSKKQVVSLEAHSEVLGDIIFDDGNGEVILSGQSKVRGKVIGGKIVSK